MIYDKQCDCEKVHSEDCPYFKKFEMEDLTTYRRFQLWECKLNGDEEKYKELLDQFRKKIENSKNSARTCLSRRYYRIGDSYGYEDIMDQKYYLISESKNLEDKIASLQMKLDTALQIEKLFDDFISLAPGNVIVSISGTQRFVTKVTEKEIFVERNGEENEIILKEDIVRRGFSWIKEIRKSVRKEVLTKDIPKEDAPNIIPEKTNVWNIIKDRAKKILSKI
jgi:preprotein translocase subunit YajC